MNLAPLATSAQELPGVEFGSYTYDPATKILKVFNMLYNTMRASGLFASSAAQPAGMVVTLNADGITATATDLTSIVVQLPMFRLSR